MQRRLSNIPVNCLTLLSVNLASMMTKTPVFCLCRYVTAVEFSHHSVVTDLQWLPGVELTSRGRVSKAADGNRECNFFATTSGDGKVSVAKPDRCLCPACSAAIPCVHMNFCLGAMQHLVPRYHVFLMLHCAFMGGA